MSDIASIRAKVSRALNGLEPADPTFNDLVEINADLKSLQEIEEGLRILGSRRAIDSIPHLPAIGAKP